MDWKTLFVGLLASAVTHLVHQALAGRKQQEIIHKVEHTINMPDGAVESLIENQLPTVINKVVTNAATTRALHPLGTAGLKAPGDSSK